MNKDANVVFQIEFAADVTAGVTGYLVLVQEALEASVSGSKVLGGQKFNPVVLPQSDGQPADFPLFMLTSEMISVQVTKRVLTFNLNYEAGTMDAQAVTAYVTGLAKELKKRLDEKVKMPYARFDVSFYRFLQLKDEDDEAKARKTNEFVKKLLNLDEETEPIDGIQGFQSSYITKHDERVSKKIFYAFAINRELKSHAIQLGVGAIAGNVGGYDFLTFENLLLEDADFAAFSEYVEQNIAGVIDERVESVSKCVQ